MPSNLAQYILEIIVSRNQNYGIYHFTDAVAMTWFTFGKKILTDNGLIDIVQY